MDEKNSMIKEIKYWVLKEDTFVVYENVKALLQEIKPRSKETGQTIFILAFARFHMFCHILFTCDTKKDWVVLYSHALTHVKSKDSENMLNAMKHGERLVGTMTHDVPIHSSRDTDSVDQKLRAFTNAENTVDSEQNIVGVRSSQKIKPVNMHKILLKDIARKKHDEKKANAQSEIPLPFQPK